MSVHNIQRAIWSAVAVLPEGIVRAGGRSRLFRWRRHGALVLLTQRIHSGMIVRGGGSTVVGRRLVADGLHARTKDNMKGAKIFLILC